MVVLSQFAKIYNIYPHTTITLLCSIKRIYNLQYLKKFKDEFFLDRLHDHEVRFERNRGDPP